MLFRGLAVGAFERVGDGQVIGLKPRERQRRQDSLAHQVVREPVCVLARGDQEVAPDRFVERIAQLMARKLAEGFEQRDVEVSSDDAGRYEHSLGGLAEPLDAPADQAAHALRQLQVLLRVARLSMAAPAEHALRL